jgi:hypothetical protein
MMRLSTVDRIHEAWHKNLIAVQWVRSMIDVFGRERDSRVRRCFVMWSTAGNSLPSEDASRAIRCPLTDVMQEINLSPWLIRGTSTNAIWS